MLAKLTLWHGHVRCILPGPRLLIVGMRGRSPHSPACLLPACSALRDRRFAPIEARELPQLKCTVSLLSGFEPAAGPEDWEVGTHGEPARGMRTGLSC